MRDENIGVQYDTATKQYTEIMTDLNLECILQDQKLDPKYTHLRAHFDGLFLATSNLIILLRYKLTLQVMDETRE